jgi:hypothetical protein
MKKNKFYIVLNNLLKTEKSFYFLNEAIQKTNINNYS